MIRPKVNMPQSEKKILDTIEQYEVSYFAFDQPVPFVGGLTLYPVSIRHYYEFLTCSNCLTLNKLDDPKAVLLGHLSYLITKLEDKEEGPMWSFKFTKIIELCLHIPLGFRCSECGKHISFDEFSALRADPKNENIQKGLCECGGKLSATIGYKQKENSKSHILTIDGVEISEQQFNEMRKIIMYQNLPSFRDDTFVHKSIREDQAMRNAILAKQNKGNATLERKMCCVAAKSAYKLDDIYDMSIRKFEMLLGVINDAVEYESTKIGLMTGMVSLKKGATIDHWINKPDEGMYSSGMDSDAYASQVK